MASTSTRPAPGIFTASTAPDVAKRAWPRWLALGLVMLAVAAVALFWTAEGARVLLGGIGLFLLARGVVLLRGAEGVGAGARGLGAAGGVAGLAAAFVAVLSVWLSGWVLLVAVPVALLGAAGALLARGGTARRGGAGLLVWGLLVTALLVAVGVFQDWDRATGVATVVTALGVAVLAVPVLVGAANLRAAAARPVPAAPAACAGCACGAGGCGALG